MSLAPGERFGAYEIVSLLGVGGMGEVYRARDTKLGRDVALKILPERVSTDADRIARFEREARALAALNHPRIATLYGLEDIAGRSVLAMELVEGVTLADRLRRGALPVHDAVAMAIQIAEALEAAHEKGIVHRDLKPANIACTEELQVKVLDFGLAKAVEPAAADPTDSPTLTSPALMTGLGVILGTAAYMSPEQAKGRAADTRSDIWAFGCVLYEMLTGARAFQAEDVAETLAGVLTRTPDWSALPPGLPRPLERLVRRCLERDRKQRLHDIGDARLELQEALSADPIDSRRQSSTTSHRAGLSPAATVALVAAAVAVSATAAWLAARPSAAPPRPLKRFAIDMRTTPLNTSLAPLALSPDGTKLAYATGAFEGSMLYVRALDQRDPTLLSGTTSAFNPFFSPDGQWIGFSANTGLKKVPTSGGPVVTLSPTDFTRLAGAAWSPEGNIYFAIGESGGLWKIPSGGGTRTAVTVIDAQQAEVGHVWPDLLPDGRGIVFTVLTSSGPDAYRVAVQTLDSKNHRTLVEGASFARYVPTGHLVYALAGKLFAAPFDVARLNVTGHAVEVLDGVSTDPGRGNARFSVANDGTLAFVEAAREDRRSLVWVDRRGTATPLTVPQRGFNHPSVSPDGKRFVVEVRDGAKRDLWLYTFDTGTFVRMTLDGTAAFPVWTPDAKSVAFATALSGRPRVVVQKVEGFQPAAPLVETMQSGFGIWPGSWTPDGQTLALMQGSPTSGGDIAILNRAAGSQQQPFIHSNATEWGAKLSPDGRWMAYVSNESGQWEVYVQPFPGPGTRRQISTNGGAEVVWARSGRELFYRNGARLMAVAFQTSPSFSIGNPEVLFEGPYLAGSPGAHNYDVAPDGQRFLMVKAGEEEAPRIHVMLNWLDDVKTRVLSAK